jgi:hypothetical protein
MDSTKRYVEEHKKVFSTKNKRKKIHLLKPKSLVGGSFFRLLKYHIKSIIRCVFLYPVALFEGRNFLIKTLYLSGSAKNSKALIIGNGPSQGYLEVNELDKFIESGGETFCVNDWTQNERLSAHVPTWIVFSDPLQFDKSEPNAIHLIDYLKKNSSIKVVIPTDQIRLVKTMNLKNKIYTFVDLELSIWENINPLIPRGYQSMTMYKALAWTINLGYKSIGVIGMDNTLPRNIFNDKENRVHLLEQYAGVDDCLADVSSYHSNVASYYYDVFKIFHHLEYFPNKNIFNLDPYSLTDRFKKINKENFFEDKINNNDMKI